MYSVEQDAVTALTGSHRAPGALGLPQRGLDMDTDMPAAEAPGAPAATRDESADAASEQRLAGWIAAVV
jgi:hypothetical protein